MGRETWYEVPDPLAIPSGWDYLWRAKDLSLNDNDAVSTWTDAIAAADATQGTGSLQPTYKATAADHGLPSVYFLQDYLDVSISLTQPNTIVALVQMQGLSGLNVVFDGVTARNHLWNDSGLWQMYAGAVMGIATPSPSLNTTHMVACIFNSTSSYLRQDTTDSSTGNAGTEALTTLRIGANNTGASGAEMYLTALAVKDGEATSTNLDDLYAYFQAEGWL